MSTDSLIPTPTVDELKAEISKIKEQAQIAALQEELESLKKPSEFEGSMQEPDDFSAGRFQCNLRKVTTPLANAIHDTRFKIACFISCSIESSSPR